MRRILAVIALFLVCSLGFASDQNRYGLEVDLRPAQAGFYVCEGQVKDLESGEVISAPRITAKVGSPAIAKTTTGDLISVLKVSVEPTSSAGTAELTISRAGKVVAFQKTAFRLK